MCIFKFCTAQGKNWKVRILGKSRHTVFVLVHTYLQTTSLFNMDIGTQTLSIEAEGRVVLFAMSEELQASSSQALLLLLRIEENGAEKNF